MIVWTSAVAEVPKGIPLQPSSVGPMLFNWHQLDVNRINCTIADDGPFADYRPTSSSGLEWPRGSGKKPLYTAGIWITARHVPTNSLRTAVVDYGTEFQPGPLLDTFNTYTLDDAAPRARAADPRYRLYKILRGDTLSQDYVEWPGDLGAPYIDANGNGTWDPGLDRPRLFGDQQLWAVMNDVNTSLHTVLGATPPMGLEVRALFYAVERPGVLENAMFMEWTIINKSDADYEDLYVSFWADPDLGDANDDLPGSDSTVSLGYVYNGDNDDGTSRGYGSTPPAEGFLILAGPLVPGLPGDSARIGERWIPNSQNLPATSFVTFFGGTFPQTQDPPDGSPAYAQQAHDYQMGKAGTVGEYILRPDSSRYPLYWFSGDPVAGTGDLPENFPLGNVRPQDLRMLLSAGPCTIAAGDTQYIAGAFFLAQGVDRLTSVALLKAGVGDLRDFYDRGDFQAAERQLLVNPRSIWFDSTLVGDSSKTRLCVLSSVGRVPVTVQEIVGPDAGSYTMTAPSAPFVLDSGQIATIALRFTPGTRGHHPDSVVVVTDEGPYPRRYLFIDGWGHTMVPATPGTIYGAGPSLVTINPVLAQASTIGPLRYQIWGMSIRPSTGVVYVVRPGDNASTLYRLCTQNLDLVPVAPILVRQLRAIAFSPDDTLFASTSDGRLSTVDLESGDTTLVGISSQVALSGLAFNPLSGSLWGCGYLSPFERDGILTIDRRTGEAAVVGRLGNNRGILSIAFAPEGTFYALQANTDGQNTLWSVDTTTGEGTLIGTLNTSALTAIAVGAERPLGVLPDGQEVKPSAWGLSQNYPNPFNPQTQFHLELPEAAHLWIRVVDMLGREIRTIERQKLPAGAHLLSWDGRDDEGAPVSSGTYILSMVASGNSGAHARISRKIILLK